MLLSDSDNTKDLSRDARTFAQKVTRSIIEIQPHVNNLADIVVLLEVLGYSKETVMKNGFENLHDLAKYIYDFIYSYEDQEQNKEELLKSLSTPIPDTKQRIVEGLSMIFPWLGSLILLFITGVSLWMAWGLPAELTTAFVTGVFLGLVITEGPLQIFARLFTFYYKQDNIDEVKRALKRSYMMIAVILSVTIAVLYTIVMFTHIPFELVTIISISTLTISLHRTSYVIIYALKKLGQLILAYTAAFIALLSVYYLSTELIPDQTTRYFVALCMAFAALSILAVYHHYKILTKSSIAVVAGETPHFYNPVTINDKTIKSRFSIQLWETMPYFLFGIFYFSMLFVDRIISWIFNPTIVTSGTILPMEFNSTYHAGADLALLVILSTSIIQYVIMTPIYTQVNNMIINLKVSEMKKVEQFLKYRYKLLMMASIVPSVITATILTLMAPEIMAYLGGSETSIQILRTASISNIFISIFAANSMFMMLLNKTKILAILSIIGTFIVVGAGIALAQHTFADVVFAYLLSALITAIVSTIYVGKTMKKAGSILFARYV